MHITRTIAPTKDPIHLSEMKRHLRVDFDDENALILSLISAATEHVEQFLRRQLVSARFNLKLDDLCDEMRIPNAPLQGVTGITYIDGDGATQTVSTSLYDVLNADSREEVGYVVRAYDQLWPSVRGDEHAVTITFDAGYATPATAATSDTITTTGHAYSNGDIVQVFNTGGELPGGLSANTNYYVVSASGQNFSLSLTSGGSAVDITSAGTGSFFIGVIPHSIRAAIKLLVADWYENREAQGERSLHENKAVRRLLYPHRVMEAV